MKNKTLGVLLMLEALVPGCTETWHCATCSSTKVAPEDFKDDLSRREYEQSHMCQNCQDNVFESEDLMD